MREYKPRIVDEILKDKLEAKGAVVIEGPKWCGKTTTAMQIARSVLRMDEPSKRETNIQMSEIAPERLLKGDTPRLIDEWQEVPQLWDAVRYKVDQSGNKGQFILTGSATPNHKGILHSGAGRIAKLRMRPMSLFESGNSSGDISLKDICEGRIEPKISGEVDLRKLIDFIISGGWPANQETTLKQAAYLLSLIHI